VDNAVLTRHVAEAASPRKEGRAFGGGRIWQRRQNQIPNPWNLPRLLRLSSERRGPRRKREPAQERAPVHWMISSARTKIDWGIVSPKAFAVLRLITSSNLVGC